MIKAIIDSNGVPIRFYNTEVFAEELIPPEALDISPEMHSEACLQPGSIRWNGSAFDTVTTPSPRISDAAMRQKRTRILNSTDWTQVSDSPLNDEAKANWRAYRQALRDLPLQPGWPDTVTWPTPPE